MKPLQIFVLVGFVASATPAFAGIVPGPEMGVGVTGLIVIAVAIAAYALLRYMRRKRAR